MMKVTVCFGPVGVVVPCGHGDMLVRDLMRQATLRYRKATGKSASSWLAVHSLQSQAGGGLLDPDDRLLDVVDDREQIVANFEDEETRHVTGGHHHSGDRGDGASGGGSSVGSSSAGGNSPELFLPHTHLHTPFTETDIEVTGAEQIAAAGLTPLQVRRGSEPALNHLAPSAPSPAADPTKRWSAAPLIEDEPAPTSAVARKAQHRKESSRQRRSSENGHLSPTWGEEEENESGRNGSAFSRFVRDSNRLSMQFLGEGAVNGVRWVEAAERAAQDHSTAPCAPRKEPLGANSSSPVMAQHPRESDIDDEAALEILEFVVLRNEEGPLGIHVVPDYDRLGQDRGLLVQGIEPGGRIDQDGRLAFGDRIIEINGHNLLNMPFQTVQEIFRDSLRSPELQLRVVKNRSISGQSRRPPAPVFPRSSSQQLGPQGQRAPSEERDNVAMVEGEEKVPSVHTKIATVSPTKKVPSVHPASRNANILLTANTRKIGKKLEIELIKGPHGLGFSITTRDNPAGGNCPIYIKNILPKGAAVEDGRLRPGDRLLEVNNVAMTGKTQSEAVSTLRNAPAGSKVSLVVSRQEKGDESPRLPRELAAAVPSTEEMLRAPGQYEPPEKANDDGLIFPWKHREIVTFDIPVHDTEKAGLGVSVKGKTTAGTNGTIDLGIFVKSVIHGGAASRDGRLRTNDQLIDINGASLLGTSNSDAMETLRRGMHQEGPKPGVITLTVARRVASTPSSNNASPHSLEGTSGRDSANSLLSSSSGTETFGTRLDGEGPTPENSCASENSDNTVIFLPKMNGDVPRPPDYVKPPERRMINPMDPLSQRNPVIDRLTGQQHNALRNESYYRATNDSWNSSMMVHGNIGDKFGSPTINCATRETVLIEEEYTPRQIIAPHPRRPDNIPLLNFDRNQQPPDGHPMTPMSEDPSTPRIPNADITYASQTSLEGDAAGFSRDAFGRQSMSEKRHAALDAKNTDTYQRNKKLRDERERQKHSQGDLHDDHRRECHMNGHADFQEGRHVPGALYRATSAESIISMTRSQAGSEFDNGKLKELGPALGMKKSSSLESLQTMVQEIVMQDDGEIAYTYRGSQGPVKVIRGRGCNESFRAAVDRSYEAPLTDLRGRMETLSEEETETGNGNFGRGTRQQSSLNSALDNKYGKKDNKKKAGLFKGIGSMFRFGKHRKSVENPLQGGRVLVEEEEEASAQERERQLARQAAQEEQQRIHEQYQRLMQRQRQTESQQQMNAGGHPDMQPPMQPQFQPPQSQLQSRTERIQQLRAQHQRRHAERRGQYPLDEREERYEQVIRQRLEQPHPQVHSQSPQVHLQSPQVHLQSPQVHLQSPQVHLQSPQVPAHPQPQSHSPQPDVVHHHHRTASYDLYGEMARPGSRSAIADPNRYSHYVNYEEIQHHLSKRTEQLSEQQIIQMRQQVQQQRGKVEEESRRQQHYHSQRRDPREVTQQRPVSNYFEYESVQAVMRGQHMMMHPPHHGPQQKQHFVRDSNANSLPRRGQERSEQPPHKTGNYVGPPRQYGPPPPNINNNNNSAKPSSYAGSMRGGPHVHDSYVPVHSRASSRSNGSAFPTKLIVQSGSKV